MLVQAFWVGRGQLGLSLLIYVVADPCDPNPCENGGSCTFGSGDTELTCICGPGFIGERCEVPGSTSNDFVITVCKTYYNLVHTV